VETGSILIRLRELAVQASSDTIGDREREFLDKEFLQLKDEIDRIARSTEFNGTRLLLGSADISEELKNNHNSFPLEIQVSSEYYRDSDEYDERNPVNIIKVDMSDINILTSGEHSLHLGTYEDGTRVHEKTKAQNSINVIDSAINRVNEHRAYFGAVQNRLSSALNNLGVQVQNLSESQSRILDTDFASETAMMTSANILQQAGTAILANANAQPNIALSLLGS
jgi:flagellin